MPIRPWIMAARPKTLPAAVAPVVLGSALAYHQGVYALLPAVVCLVFALLIQIGTNYANDYFDFVKGADTEERVGPTRAVASGAVTPSAMLTATALIFTASLAVGWLLVPYGGWWLVLVGLLSVGCGIAYTGGPYPLGYNGLGDIFVFIFFGLVAVGLTYYVQAGTLSANAFLLGAAVGALATNLLVVNNYRDAPTDAKAGKRTLVVRFGRTFGLAQFAFLNALAFAIPVILALRDLPPALNLTLLLYPLAVFLRQRVATAKTLKQFNLALAGTAAMLLLYSGVIATVLILTAPAS